MHLLPQRPRPSWTGAALLGAALGCGPAEPPPAPDVIWISVDTLRADHLSAYGYERETSPNLDRLADAGVRFETCLSTTSWTLPAHLSMLTGLAISAHGIDDERIFHAVGRPGAPERVPLRGVFASEVLAAAGYRTAGRFTWEYLEADYGFGPGFETWERVGGTIYSDATLERRYQRLVDVGNETLLETWRAERPEEFDFQRPTDEFAVDAGLAWLEASAGGEAPRFLFLHLFDPHDAYVPSAPFDRAFTEPAYRGPIDGRAVSSPESPVRAGMDPADLRQLIALYDGEIAWSDSQLGRLFDHVAASERGRDTLTFVTSDHGEEFFEHGGKTHRGQLYLESVRVPWILNWPRAVRGGRVVEGPVGLIDQAPTLYGLLGLDAPVELTGADLSDVVHGRARNRERTYSSLLLKFGENYQPDRNVALRRGADSFLFRYPVEGEPELYAFDRRANPDEAGPGQALGRDEPLTARALELMDELRAQLRAQRDAAPPRTLVGAPLSAAQRRELAAMGYASGEAPADMSSADEQRLALDGGLGPVD